MAANDSPKGFEKFLLSEYSNIVQAHFKAIETISAFFRYYLLIMAIPFSVIPIIASLTPASKESFITLILHYRALVAFLFFCVSLVGFCVLCYIISLRLDAILYARVVNGIRKYFYDSSDEEFNFKIRMRVLPQTPHVPPYFEASFFMPVVAAFGFINSVYFGCSYLILLKGADLASLVYILALCVFLLAVIFHILIYRLYASHRNTSYLRSNIIGIDIDGVLNKHRDHFCILLKENANKVLDPQNINIIPVHEDPNSGVTREDERKVFNDPHYWVDMPEIEEASKEIRKLINVFRMKVYVFTYRPWPDAYDKKELSQLNEVFLSKCRRIPIKLRIGSWFGMSRIKPLKQLTKEWLKSKDITFNKFIMERGNDYSYDPSGEFNNRFYISSKKKIRYFVEDDAEKAIKLCYICDIVFLVNHPYNKRFTDLPSNVIRVNNWSDIYKQIRLLS